MYKFICAILRKVIFPLYAVFTNAQPQSCNRWKTTPNKLTGVVLTFFVKSKSFGVSLGLGLPLGFATA